MTENEVIKIFENEVIILDCWIEHCKDIIADCETEDDEFDDDKERAELSLKDYTERKEAFDVAIEALKEIQLYKDNKLCLVPEDVYSRQCSELDAYKEIGSVEECREAVGEWKMIEKRCPVGGVDRSGKIDKISLQNAVETPFWMMVWATEPERLIDVRMSYSDLKIICYLIDSERNRRAGEQNE